MDDMRYDGDGDKSLFGSSIDYLLWPIHVAKSPTFLRTYLRTALLFITSTILFGVAIVAYSSFYYSYIPIRGISVPVYLQFDHGSASSNLGTQTEKLFGDKWPYGLANLHGLIDRQKYDVLVEMDVPRSESNLQVGNWMVELDLLGSGSGSGGVKSMLDWDEEEQTGIKKDEGSSTTGSKCMPRDASVIEHSRRPAILTYRSPLIDFVFRVLRLPLYLIGWHTESEHVRVSMMESVTFSQGQGNIPSSLRLEVRSRLPLEVYRVKVQIFARLEGLRWLMYRYWLTSAIVGTSLFWSVEMGVLLFTWGIFTLLSGESAATEYDEKKKRIKHEPGMNADDESVPPTPFSDTDRTFPTLPSQQPLMYKSPKEERETPSLDDIPIKEEAEADDEDDDFVLEEPVPSRVEREVLFTDSGIGTSLESSAENGLSRRKSGKMKDGRN